MDLLQILLEESWEGSVRLFPPVVRTLFVAEREAEVGCSFVLPTSPHHMALPVVDLLKIDSTAVVSPNATIKGRVTIGAGCIVHPNAVIIGHSPVELGENNVVEEQATIINSTQPGIHTTAVRIGDNNMFEVGSYFENSHCGSLNIFESKSRVSDNCMLGDGSIIGAGVSLASEIIGDKVIIFSGGSVVSKPVTRKLGLLATEEALDNHTMMRSTIAPLLES